MSIGLKTLRVAGLTNTVNMVYPIMFIYEAYGIKILPFAIISLLHIIKNVALMFDYYLTNGVLAIPAGILILISVPLTGPDFGYVKSIIALLCVIGVGDSTNRELYLYQPGPGTLNKFIQYFTKYPEGTMTLMSIYGSLGAYLCDYNIIVKGLMVNAITLVAMLFYGGECVTTTTVSVGDIEDRTHMYKHFSLFLSCLLTAPFVQFGDTTSYITYVNYMAYIGVTIGYFIGIFNHDMNTHSKSYFFDAVKIIVYFGLNQTNRGLFLIPMFLIYHDLAMLKLDKMDTRITDLTNYFDGKYTLKWYILLSLVVLTYVSSLGVPYVM